MPVRLVLAALGAAAGFAYWRLDSSARGLKRQFPSAPEGWFKPRDRAVHLKLLALQTLKDLARPREVIAQYAKDHPDHAVGHFWLCSEAAADERWADALTHAKKILRLEPSSSVGHYLAGTCHVRLGSWDEAERHFKRFLALDPESSLVPAVKTSFTWMANQRKAAKKPRKRPGKKRAPSAR